MDLRARPAVKAPSASFLINSQPISYRDRLLSCPILNCLHLRRDGNALLHFSTYFLDLKSKTSLRSAYLCSVCAHWGLSSDPRTCPPYNCISGPLYMFPTHPTKKVSQGCLSLWGTVGARVDYFCIPWPLVPLTNSCCVYVWQGLT